MARTMVQSVRGLLRDANRQVRGLQRLRGQAQKLGLRRVVQSVNFEIRGANRVGRQMARLAGVKFNVNKAKRNGKKPGRKPKAVKAGE